MVIAAAAPMTAMATDLSLSLALGVGTGTVGQLILAGMLLVVFAVGFVALIRNVANAGAYHVFVGYGCGSRKRPRTEPHRRRGGLSYLV